MKNQNSQTRRDFLKLVTISAASLPLLRFSKAFAAPKEDPVPAGMTPVSETDPVAAAMGYHKNAKDIDYTRYPMRKKPEAKNQHCQNCALFTKLNSSWGKCQILANGVVSAGGWCGSWSKKS